MQIGDPVIIAAFITLVAGALVALITNFSQHYLSVSIKRREEIRSVAEMTYEEVDNILLTVIEGVISAEKFKNSPSTEVLKLLIPINRHLFKINMLVDVSLPSLYAPLKEYRGKIDEITEKILKYALDKNTKAFGSLIEETNEANKLMYGPLKNLIRKKRYYSLRP